jgi:hypothetical protein
MNSTIINRSMVTKMSGHFDPEQAENRTREANRSPYECSSGENVTTIFAL